MNDKKRTTDLNSMLGTAKRAAEVPRPQVEPEHELPIPLEKRVNITLQPELHRRLKTLAASRGEKMQDLVDRAITNYLNEQH